MRELAFIHDTCTLPGYVARSAGLHPALRFQYRPATAEERLRLALAGENEAAPEFGPRTAALLAQKLVRWELVDGSPAPPIGASAILRLQPELFEKIHRIVMGYSASEIDPAWAPEMVDELATDLTEAAHRGCTPGEAGDERREKN